MPQMTAMSRMKNISHVMLRFTCGDAEEFEERDRQKPSCRCSTVQSRVAAFDLPQG
jgi:hypothetical protein